MKPIEPGCWAVVTGCVAHPEFIGTTVRCVRPAYEFFRVFEDAWVIDGSPCPLAREAHLMRIDGDESVTTETREEISA